VRVGEVPYRVGVMVVYRPRYREEWVGDDEEIGVGSVGIFLRMGSSWEKYVPGLAPMEVLFGDRVCFVYQDQVEVRVWR